MPCSRDDRLATAFTAWPGPEPTGIAPRDRVGRRRLRIERGRQVHHDGRRPELSRQLEPGRLDELAGRRSATVRDHRLGHL